MSEVPWQRLPDISRVRRRSVGTLALAQMFSSLGAGVGPSVGVLLAAEVTHSEAWAGIARASSTIGAALVALPLASFAASHGRRAALTLAFACTSAGLAVVAVSAQVLSAVLFIIGMTTIGLGIAAGLQARFAGADLAEPARRGRTLSIVVWAGTVGAVLGPSLAAPGARIAVGLGWHPYAGAFTLATVLLAASAALVFFLLRPDPLLLAQRYDGSAAGHTTRPRGRAAYAHAWRALAVHATARAALLAQVLAHIVMVVIMTMTPVHLHHRGHSLTIVGITISIHVLGMWGFAPIFGWSSDRFGPRRTIIGGSAILLASCLICALAPHDPIAVGVGLFLLGLGWSAVTVPAAALLTHAVTPAERPYVQGFGDMLMNAGAAFAAAISGPIMAVAGFAWLSVLGAIAVLPIAARMFVRTGDGRAARPKSA
ncbi:MAG: MFS transporter [Bowdeniella nasicola]|nr:MFS transporter [Bowdeniella nasicola]